MNSLGAGRPKGLHARCPMMQAGFIGGWVGYRLCRWMGAKAARGEGYCSGGGYRGRSKLEVMFGPEIWTELAGKVVIDFGCGPGQEAIEIARHGARRVIGLDIRQRVLDDATRAAEKAGVLDRCVFTTRAGEKADVIVSLDSFEHFGDPAGVLREMRGLLKDDGRVIASFGPTWFHPYGGHLFSVFPWAHLVFTERALIRWRSEFKADGAARFSEVEGGLNQMTIRRFGKLLDESDFAVERLEPVPIRKARFLHNRLTREFLTAVVRCKLAPK